MTCANENQCSLHINGYRIFDIDEDGMYVAKSKEALLENILKYGDIEEVYGISEQEMFDQVREIELCSEEVRKVRIWDDESVSSIYDLYKDVAIANQGTQMILCYNL